MTMTGSLFDVGSFTRGSVLPAGSLTNSWATLGSEIDGRANYVASSKPWPRTKAAGTLSLAGTTDAYDTTFVDVAFAANELAAGDIVESTIWFENQAAAARVVAHRLDLENTTANPTGTELSVNTAAVNESALVKSYITQSPNTTDIAQVRNEYLSAGDTAWTIATFSLDSNDANLFTTAFDLRLNFRYNVNDAVNTTTIRYLVEIHHAPR
jgi:hypothetical protein